MSICKPAVLNWTLLRCPRIWSKICGTVPDYIRSRAQLPSTVADLGYVHHEEPILAKHYGGFRSTETQPQVLPDRRADNVSAAVQVTKLSARRQAVRPQSARANSIRAKETQPQEHTPSNRAKRVGQPAGSPRKTSQIRGNQQKLRDPAPT
jgi:hypothetical protein